VALVLDDVLKFALQIVNEDNFLSKILLFKEIKKTFSKVYLVLGDKI
jgi:hypothetical protein